MEDALALLTAEHQSNNWSVLILVVMEDALAQRKTLLREKTCISLNPCCNGRCTRTF